MKKFFCSLWSGDEGQDIAEYAVMLAVILVIVVVQSVSSVPTQTMSSLPLPVQSRNSACETVALQADGSWVLVAERTARLSGCALAVRPCQGRSTRDFDS
jgi:hypothetical protein